MSIYLFHGLLLAHLMLIQDHCCPGRDGNSSSRNWTSRKWKCEREMCSMERRRLVMLTRSPIGSKEMWQRPLGVQRRWHHPSSDLQLYLFQRKGYNFDPNLPDSCSGSHRCSTGPIEKASSYPIESSDLYLKYDANGIRAAMSHSIVGREAKGRTDTKEGRPSITI